MAQRYTATQRTFGKWHLIKGSGRLMTLKSVRVRYGGKTHTKKEYRVRFFNTKSNALKEAKRLNAGGKKRTGDC